MDEDTYKDEEEEEVWGMTIEKKTVRSHQSESGVTKFILEPKTI